MSDFNVGDKVLISNPITDDFIGSPVYTVSDCGGNWYQFKELKGKHVHIDNLKLANSPFADRERQDISELSASKFKTGDIVTCNNKSPRIIADSRDSGWTDVYWSFLKGKSFAVVAIFEEEGKVMYTLQDGIGTRSFSIEEGDIELVTWGSYFEGNEKIEAVDVVNSPKHYMLIDGFEVKDLMRLLLNRIELSDVGFSHFQSSCYKEAMQYFLRFMLKNGLEDLEKGQYYIQEVIKEWQEKVE